MSRVNLFDLLTDSSGHTSRLMPTDTSTSRTPFFLKKLRNKSKTYSGEEINANLNKKINEQKSLDNKSEPRLRSQTNIEKKRFFIFKNHCFLIFKFIFFLIFFCCFKKSLTTKEKLVKRTNFTINNYGSIELVSLKFLN